MLNFAHAGRVSRRSISGDVARAACWPSLIPSEDPRRTALDSGRRRRPSAAFSSLQVWGSQEVVVIVVVVWLRGRTGRRGRRRSSFFTLEKHWGARGRWNSSVRGAHGRLSVQRVKKIKIKTYKSIYGILRTIRRS